MFKAGWIALSMGDRSLASGFAPRLIDEISQECLFYTVLSVCKTV